MSGRRCHCRTGRQSHLVVSAEARRRARRVCDVYRQQRRPHRELWRAVPRRRTDLHRLRRVCDQPNRGQALRQTSIDALDTSGCTPAASDPNTRPQQRSRSSHPSLLPRLQEITGHRHCPRFVMGSHGGQAPLWATMNQFKRIAYLGGANFGLVTAETFRRPRTAACLTTADFLQHDRKGAGLSPRSEHLRHCQPLEEGLALLKNHVFATAVGLILGIAMVAWIRPDTPAGAVFAVVGTTLICFVLGSLLYFGRDLLKPRNTSDPTPPTRKPFPNTGDKPWKT